MHCDVVTYSSPGYYVPPLSTPLIPRRRHERSTPPPLPPSSMPSVFLDCLTIGAITRPAIILPLKTNCMPASVASVAAGAHYSWTTHAARCTLRITADVQMKSGFSEKEIMSLSTHHVHAKTYTHFFLPRYCFVIIRRPRL